MSDLKHLQNIYRKYSFFLKNVMHVNYNKPVPFVHLISFTNLMKIEAKQMELDETFRMQTSGNL